MVSDDISYNDKLKKPDDSGETDTSQPINLSAPSSEAPTIGGGAKAPGAPTSSGRFTNLQSYLDANAGYNKSGGGLAGQINSDLTNQGKDLGNKFTTEYGNSKDQANNQLVQNNSDLVNKATTNPSSLSDDEKSSFTKLRDASYNPVDFNGTYNNYMNQANNLQDLTNQAGSEAGRYSLLGNLYGKGGGYSQGQKKLDNLLLQNTADPNQIAALNNLQQIPSSLKSNIETANTNMSTLNTANQGLNAGVQKSTRDALGTAIGDFGTKAGTQLTDAQSQYATKQQQLQDALAGFQGRGDNNGVDQAQSALAQLSLIPPTQNNVISSQDQAYINALNSLSGGKLSGGAQATLDNFNNNPDAGKWADLFGTVKNPEVGNTVPDSQGVVNPITGSTSVPTSILEGGTNSSGGNGSGGHVYNIDQDNSGPSGGAPQAPVGPPLAVVSSNNPANITPPQQDPAEAYYQLMRSMGYISDNEGGWISPEQQGNANSG